MGLDPVSIAVLLASELLGKDLGAYVGPYTAILVASLAGVIVGVYRREQNPRMPTWAFVVVHLIMTLGVTTFAASLVARWLPVDATVLFFPVAFVVPAVGDDWKRIGVWFADWLRRRAEKEV